MILGLPLASSLGTWRKPTPIGRTLVLLVKAATNRKGEGKEAENAS